MFARDRKIIYLAGFLFSFPLALTSYVNSSFLATFINEYYVGAIYVAASIVTVITMAKMPQLLSRWGDRKTTLMFSSLSLGSLVILAFAGQSYLIIPAFVIFFTSITALGATLDIFLEDFSVTAQVGSFRGIYLTILNSAWVISQLIAGPVINKSSLKGIYLLAALFMVLVVGIFTFFLSDFKDPEYKKDPFGKTVLFFLQNKKALKIYSLNFILQFFYAWMVVYTPIYLHEHIGFPWDKVTKIFSVMLLPFALLSLPLGRLSDRVGEKKMLIFGFSIIALSTSLLPLVYAQIIWIWAAILFCTRVGAATISVMSDSYFFKIITKENAGATSFYRNTYPVAYIVAPLVAMLVFALIPSFNYLFYVLTGILLVGLWLTLSLQDVR